MSKQQQKPCENYFNRDAASVAFLLYFAFSLSLYCLTLFTRKGVLTDPETILLLPLLVASVAYVLGDQYYRKREQDKAEASIAEKDNNDKRQSLLKICIWSVLTTFSIRTMEVFSGSGDVFGSWVIESIVVGCVFGYIIWRFIKPCKK